MVVILPWPMYMYIRGYWRQNSASVAGNVNLKFRCGGFRSLSAIQLILCTGLNRSNLGALCADIPK